MNYGSLSGIGKKISRLVQGTVMIDGKDEGKDFALLDEIFALGCTTFDTAHVYGNGANERAFGRWLSARSNREQVVVIAKGAHHNQDRRRVTPFDISSDLHDSLARMQLDYIDLYILHRDDESVPVGPIVEVLNEHMNAGRLRAFGGSNWRHERIAAANDYAEKHQLTPFTLSSPNFSLAEQVKEPWEGCISISGDQAATARRYYQETQLALFTWSSLAGGFFSGRFSRDNLDSFSDYLDTLCVESYCYEENFQRLDRANQLAQERSVSVTQIAMAYVLAQPLNIFALVGCQNAREFAANIAAMQLELSSAEIQWLESGKPR